MKTLNMTDRSARSDLIMRRDFSRNMETTRPNRDHQARKPQQNTIQIVARARGISATPNAFWMSGEYGTLNLLQEP